MTPTEPIISGLYYSQFRDATFVIQAEAEAVENPDTTLAILLGIRDLLDHGIRVALVFGKGTRFEKELCTRFGAQQHPETNRLIILMKGGSHVVPFGTNRCPLFPTQNECQFLQIMPLS